MATTSITLIASKKEEVQTITGLGNHDLNVGTNVINVFGRPTSVAVVIGGIILTIVVALVIIGGIKACKKATLLSLYFNLIKNCFVFSFIKITSLIK